jgi:hypothetical protein
MVGEIPQQDTTILVGMEVIHQNILAGGHPNHHQVVVAKAVVDLVAVVAVEDNI